MPPSSSPGDAAAPGRGAGGEEFAATQALATLRAHDEMLTLAFTNAREMMLLARVERGPIFRVAAVNRRYLDVVRAAGFELTAERLIGLTFSEVRALFGFPDEVWEPMLKRYRTVVEAKQPIHYEETTHTPNGVFYGQSTVSPVSDEAGVCRGVLYTSNDVTAQRRAEAALRDSEAKFAMAFRAAPFALTISELESGRYIDVNRGFERLSGFTRAEVVGRTSLELGLWHEPEDRERLVRELQATGSVRDLELKVCDRQRRVAIALCSCELIELGGVRCILNTIQDITENRRAEQALRESEAKFATVFRAAPGAMGLSDLATRQFVEVNDGYCRLFGYAREEMIGKTALELGVWADERQRDQFLEALMSRGSVQEMELTCRRRDGGLVHCLLGAEIVEIHGRPHLLSTLFDVTARRRIEQERAEFENRLRRTQKLDALGQLAGGIAHDFNNILTAIGAYAELAVWDAANPASVRANLAQVRRATERATDLVRQILAFSRQQPQTRKPIALGPVIEEAVKLIRSIAPKSIEVRVQLDGAAPVVLADPTQIHQVLMNLCTNAVHAMRQRAGTIAIALGTVEVPESAAPDLDIEPGLHACLTVSDEGHGMDDATRARIFEPFFTTKEPGEGTGLGLSVVHGIVQDHDGAITVRSRPGAGTVFEIFLPAHAAGATAGSEAGEHDLPRGTGERVLLVDDEPAIAHAAGMLLQRLGYRCTTHTEPEAALRAFESGALACDVVLTDLTMPRVSGIELARRVLARRPDLPVVLASGHMGAWSAESLHSVGIATRVMKPLSAAKLARALAEALAGRKSASA